MSRSLPKKNNPLILADATPAYEDLLALRRLVKTKLSVKPEEVGISNATKPKNPGVFEYAHLRAPLPEDLESSEMFPSHTHARSPAILLLMRRSKDGFVSGTGMFKLAFPWAKAEEAKNEQEYMKSREDTSQEEDAGNVWISPMFALELAKEYKMYDWVRALLDPADIMKSSSSAKKIIPPPKYELPIDELSGSQHSRSQQPTVSPNEKSTSPCMPPQARSAKDVLNTPSTVDAYDNLQKTFNISISMEAAKTTPLPAKADTDKIEVRVNRGRDIHILNLPSEFTRLQMKLNMLEVKSLATTADIQSQDSPEHQLTDQLVHQTGEDTN